MSFFVKGLEYLPVGVAIEAVTGGDPALVLVQGSTPVRVPLPEAAVACRCWELGLLYEEADPARAVGLMSVCVAYERQIGHPGRRRMRGGWQGCGGACRGKSPNPPART